MTTLSDVVSDSGLLPHGQCLLWKPELLWLHVVSDALIAAAYFAIPVALVYFVRKRRHVPFPGVFLMFGAFIVACGTTHLMGIWTLWTPSYWAAGGVKVGTALLSVGTAFMLIPIMPQALSLRTPEELEEINRTLEREVAARTRISQEHEGLIGRLRETLARIKTLEGILPICSHCKMIRDGQGHWQPVEAYVRARTHAQFSHGICPTCLTHYYPDVLPGPQVP